MTGFAAPNPYASLGASGLSDGLSMFGQSAGGGMSPEDMYYSAGAEAFKMQPGFEQQRLDIARQAAAPPSKWATGASTFGSVAQGLAGLGSIYLGLKGMKEQKKMNKFNMGVTNTNLNNSIMDYNRRLGDTLHNRSLNNGRGDAWVSDQLSKFSARRS